MKVTSVAHTCAPDVKGASSFAQHLAAGLAPGHEVHVLAPSRTTRAGSGRAPSGVVEHRHGDVAVLVDRLGGLLDDPARASAMGASGRSTAMEHDLGATLDAFVALCTAARHASRPLAAAGA